MNTLFPVISILLLTVQALAQAPLVKMWDYNDIV